MFISRFLECSLLYTVALVASQPLGKDILPKSNSPPFDVAARGVGRAAPSISLDNSFSASIGAVDVHPDHMNGGRRGCYPTVGKYPVQLNQRSFTGKNITFLTCTGDITEKDIKAQLPALGNKAPLIVTLAGGNDALFTRTLKACVFRPTGSVGEKCDVALEASVDIIENELYNKTSAVYEAIFSESKRRGVSTVIFHTLYDNFFNADTDWCDGQSMGIFLGTGATKLTKDIRSKLNSLTERMNQVITRAATEWNWKRSEGFHRELDYYRPPNQIFIEDPSLLNQNGIVTVLPNNRFDGHRFCERGVDKFNDKSVWFFTAFDGDTSEEINAANFNTDEYHTIDYSALDYSHVNTTTCIDDSQVQNNVGLSIECDLARYFAKASDEKWSNINRRSERDRVTPRSLPTGFRKAFHPKTQGFTAIKDENVEASEAEFKPSLPNLNFTSLTILPVGDSITWGYGSTDGNGYRAQLSRLVSRWNGKVRFIGSQKSGNMANNENEGYPGNTISQIASKLRKNLPQRKDYGQNTPNVILLHAGTNDMNKAVNIYTAHLRLGALIDQLLHTYPNAAIIVSTIIPSKDPKTMARIREFNIRVPLEVQSRREKGKKVWLARMPVTEEGLTDSLHPTNYGYIAMAYGWIAALQDIMKENWI